MNSLRSTVGSDQAEDCDGRNIFAMKAVGPIPSPAASSDMTGVSCLTDHVSRAGGAAPRRCSSFWRVRTLLLPPGWTQTSPDCRRDAKGAGLASPTTNGAVEAAVQL